MLERIKRQTIEKKETWLWLVEEMVAKYGGWAMRLQDKTRLDFYLGLRQDFESIYLQQVLAWDLCRKDEIKEALLLKRPEFQALRRSFLGKRWTRHIISAVEAKKRAEEILEEDKNFTLTYWKETSAKGEQVDQISKIINLASNLVTANFINDRQQGKGNDAVELRQRLARPLNRYWEQIKAIHDA